VVGERGAPKRGRETGCIQRVNVLETAEIVSWLLQRETLDLNSS
jgi:hypothetical protein